MAKKMLIDASHLEEKRVVIVDGLKLDELDIETSTKKQIKGNIYLAKVARVEPSLQAAFVDYGGNRHGFLAFNEIHPDYYQIPVADRDELKAALNREEAEENAKEEETSSRRSRRRGRRNAPKKSAPEAALDGENTENAEQNDAEEKPADANDEGENDEHGADVETVTETDNDYRRPRPKIRSYKIQEVIRRGQILLVQVVKEERGNKGAALTTYLSLAGRYCVLMPNSAHRGGVSRKITSVADRKKLKTIISGLDVPDSMSIIVRTAGRERTKTEIKRDYDYLIKTWVQIRDKTIESSAPTLIHEEGDIIKRALRDMYSRDITDILIEGEDDYRAARDFMKMLTPSHVKKIHLYKDEDVPLFFRYQVESQLESIHNNIVQLKSGAYLVMDQTEALVAIDVNSGRATKERNIEETALKTNLEAADEIARQLRLRDMAGLVVIDFIDMEEARNNHAVERRLKEALKRDRARIQMSRMSGLGLMEISRQRLHSSFIESSYSVCPHCRGKGMLRSTESASIHTIHLLEEEALKRRFSEIRLTVPTPVALYVLNQKRDDLIRIQKQYDVLLHIDGDDSLPSPVDYRIERVARPGGEPVPVGDEDGETAQNNEKQNVSEQQQGNGESRSARRRRHRRDRRRENFEDAETQNGDSKTVSVRHVDESDVEVIHADEMFEEGLKANESGHAEENGAETQEGEERHRRRRRRHRKNAAQKSDAPENQQEQVEERPAEAPEPASAVENAEQEDRPRRRRRRFTSKRVEEAENAPSSDNDAPQAENNDPASQPKSDKPKKKGWWQRLAGG